MITAPFSGSGNLSSSRRGDAGPWTCRSASLPSTSSSISTRARPPPPSGPSTHTARGGRRPHAWTSGGGAGAGRTRRARRWSRLERAAQAQAGPAAHTPRGIHQVQATGGGAAAAAAAAGLERGWGGGGAGEAPGTNPFLPLLIEEVTAARGTRIVTLRGADRLGGGGERGE